MAEVSGQGFDRSTEVMAFSGVSAKELGAIHNVDASRRPSRAANTIFTHRKVDEYPAKYNLGTLM